MVQHQLSLIVIWVTMLTLMVEVFGDRGKHARAAVGMGSLPFNLAVEIEMIVEVE